MLCLSRSIGQKIRIGDDILITINDVTSYLTEDRVAYKVRVGITAPRDITVHREEIYLEIQEENKKKKRGE